jgi:hypothetical protein
MTLRGLSWLKYQFRPDCGSLFMSAPGTIRISSDVRAASIRIGLRADKDRAAIRGGHMGFGEQAADRAGIAVIRPNGLLD